MMAGMMDALPPKPNVSIGKISKRICYNHMNHLIDTEGDNKTLHSSILRREKAKHKPNQLHIVFEYHAGLLGRTW